jgi:hypothetical protein
MLIAIYVPRVSESTEYELDIVALATRMTRSTGERAIVRTVRRSWALTDPVSVG